MSADTSNQVICRQGLLYQINGGNISLYNNFGGTLTATNNGLDNYITTNNFTSSYLFDSIIPSELYTLETTKQKQTYRCGYYTFSNSGIAFPSNLKDITAVYPVPNSTLTSALDGIIIKNPNNSSNAFDLHVFIIPAGSGTKNFTYRITTTETINSSVNFTGKIVNVPTENSVYSNLFIARNLTAVQVTLYATLFSGNAGETPTSGIICVFVD